ncbi:ATP-dependent DNA helicase [Candidatus Protochlamydia sp. W-9]|uniref:ATP-dependent DNA helicase n=1 Tax=Candidatus Protochlamydia sp. W-9 TaxID=1785087 RepID=UPI00096A7180|nr:helicase C-terminal domain-containing protein [Candidatus Protochlamydia sp. W-9]
MSHSQLQSRGLQSEKILSLLKPDGLLANSLKGFEFRPQQQQMMTNIIEAYNNDSIALIEAGTGIGKSLAYLIPALIWAARFNERTVISTNTITLQEQLLSKDIPNLLDALDLNLKAVLVKGMHNYLCIRKLEDVQMEMSIVSSEEAQEIEKIEAWRQQTVDGSRSSLSFAPTHSVWEKVGAENEACSHHECPHYQQCFFFKARRQAQDAHILIVNHHLLFADLMRRADTANYSETSILPTYRRIILDEAHHVEDIATEYFASHLHRIELMRTMGRLGSERHSQQPGKLPILKEKLQLLYNKTPPREISQIVMRLTIDLPALRHVIHEQINQTFDAFAHFIEAIKNPASRLLGEEVSLNEQKLRILNEHMNHTKWKEEIHPSASQLIDSLKNYRLNITNLEAELKLIENERLQEQTKSIRLDIQGLANRLETSISLLNHFISPPSSPNKVRWIEAHKLKSLINVHLVDADLDISKSLAEFVFSKFPTIILCSATLTSNQQFQFIRKRLGLTDKHLPYRQIEEYIYDSPFDYHKQALLAVPTDMPPPSHPDFNWIAFENIWKAIQASRGQAFVLFTSYSMLQQCAEKLSARMHEHAYVLFKQGEEARQTLLHKFKTTDRAILFGTDSFWEGVDVAGDALRCVIIVKLPFRVPTEPLIQARTEAIIEKGGEPFFEYSVPQAVVKFKQGFGRLIRNQWDRGCIVCLDTRLVTKGYGKQFLNSLPACEKVFINSEQLWAKMGDFYRKTYHLVKQNPFS